MVADDTNNIRAVVRDLPLKEVFPSNNLLIFEQDFAHCNEMHSFHMISFFFRFFSFVILHCL